METGQALARITEVANELPIDYFAVNELALINRAAGNTQAEKAAIDQLQHLLSREPDAVLELAFDYTSIGQKREAIAILEDAITRGPSGILDVDKSRVHPMLYYKLGHLYEKSGERD